MFNRGKRLSKAVCSYGIGRDVGQCNFLGCNLLPDVVPNNVNMLSTIMMLWVLRERQGPLIIAVQRHCLLFESKIMQQLLQPARFA